MIENLKEYKTFESPKTKFIGYDNLTSKSKVLGLINNEEELVNNLTGHGYIIFDQTPFFALGGGQDSDNGLIKINNKNFELIDVRKNIVYGFYIHEIDLQDTTIKIGDILELEVDKTNRTNLEISHSGLHIIGQEIVNLAEHYDSQLGSKVSNEKYRLEFVVDEKLTVELINQAVKNVNKNTIPSNIYSSIYTLTKEEAIKKGIPADHPFLENEDSIRIVEFPTYTLEACGGTHVKNTSEIKEIWFTKYDKNKKRIVTEFSSNKDYVNELFEEKLVGIYNQLLITIKKGTDLGFDQSSIQDQLDKSKELSNNWSYVSIREMNLLFRELTGTVNKYIKKLGKK